MRTMATYSKVFPNIKQQAVELTRELIRNGIWKKNISEQDKFISMGLWLHQMADLYGMERPKLYFVGGKEGKQLYKETGGGSYDPSVKAIFLYDKLSLTTLAHEFRHSMQHQLQCRLYQNDFEEDAQAWSISLFRLSAPESYQRAELKGVLKI